MVSKDEWSTWKSQTPSLDSENSSKLSMPDTGTKRRTLPRTQLPDLLETSSNTSRSTSQQQDPARFFQFQAEQQQSGSTQARLIFWKKKSTTPDLSSKLGKDGKLTPQEHSPSWQASFASFVAPLDTSPRTVQNPLASAKPKHPNLHQTKSESSGTDSKKLSSPWDPHDPRIVLNSLVQNSYSQHIRLSNLTLTLSWHLTHSRIWSWRSLVIPDFRLFLLISVFIQTHTSLHMDFRLSNSDSSMNLDSVISQAPGPANPFSYWESQKLTFLCHSVGQSWHDCTRYRWSPATISIDWVLGSIFFRQLSQHESKNSPLSRHFRMAPSENPGPVPDIPNPFRR